MVNQQDNFIAQLGEASSAQEFFTVAVQQFTESVDNLIQHIFHHTEFALKSVVDSLFEHQGPLADLSVRLKLLLGLGRISAQIYQDINLFVEMETQLHCRADGNECEAFSTLKITQFAQTLNSLDFGLLAELMKLTGEVENRDSMLFQIQQLRFERAMRSSLILVISHIHEALAVKNAT
ncbi:mannitol repressor MtlR [Nicoletella semolina]|uniref:Mannitol repressor MtlR n=1 Tax=Nicoletella semolina TaxID=271160 RepID=A0A4R2NBQ2_9PAST|nr:MltR family transcriptional regulator [Nicoletella semolina]MDH2924962.1 transcriptional regulator [Nicoletella semolina]TCP18510.1 mannitol repressor MtlR [Nicoletella semolina]